MRLSLAIPFVLAATGSALWLRPAQASLSTAAPAPSVAAAAEGSYTFDLGHSSILFRIKHFDVAWNFGRFAQFSGSFQLNEDPAKCSVNVEIDAASVDTFNESRDKHVMGPEFFSVKEHPKMTFASKRVALDGDTYTIEGDLTFHGKTKSVTMTAEKSGEKDTVRQGYKAGFLGEMTINRRDFGVETYPNEVLSDEVHLILAIEAAKQ